ncbi:MAG: phage holin family protein [Peptococcaceae bacterium]|nr:phage holin family protein [Peptococcaceae bacterium]
MKHLIVKILINAAALMFASNMIDGIYVDGFGAVVIAAIILGIVNAIIRPLLMLFTLPLNIMTFGLLTFVINGLMLKMVSTVVGGFEIVGLWPAIIGSIILTVVSTVLSWLVE